jgi:hypothetical protein
MSAAFATNLLITSSSTIPCTVLVTAMHRILTQLTFVSLVFLASDIRILHAKEWIVPLAGNVYRTEPSPGGKNFGRSGLVSIQAGDEVYSTYVHLDRPAKIRVSVFGKSSSESATLLIRTGDQEQRVDFVSGDEQLVSVGEFEISQKGYVKFDLKTVADDGKKVVELREVRIDSITEGLSLDFVQNNDGNMFYWGRRGPSVHLGYRFPSDLKVNYAYNEIAVPVGEDPLGSYYMAIGFSEGYFGMQVNGPEERRVLFSIWSPFKTDNPRDIPVDQRIEALAKGPGVHIGEFGNEGSGGQSYFVYPWKAGKTYRFLMEVTPDGDGKTTYTAWFGEKVASEKDSGQWQLIARFRRPQTTTHLKGFHSFLESFSPTHGYIGRRALYKNQWVCDVDGMWHQCTEARFTVDATGSGRHRVDFAGGTEGNAFFLKHCGFFSETVKPGTVLMRGSTAEEKPQIDFAALPRE